MKYLVLVTMLVLAGCGANDPGLAKTVKPTKTQLAALEERIKPYGMVNIEGAMQVAQAPALPGEAKYAACGACHGAQGGGGVGPALAGKTVEYIVENLSTEATTGIATFAYFPNQFGNYISKINCFCYDAQTLKPNQKNNSPRIRAFSATCCDHTLHQPIKAQPKSARAHR